MDADLDRRLLRFRNLSKKEDAGRLAQDLLSVDRARDAMEVAATGLRRNPQSAGLVVILGRVLLEGGDLPRAQEAFLQATRMDKNDADALRYLGETLLRRDESQRAAKVLARAMSLAPDVAEIGRLHERASRLARGQAVAPDADLDPAPEESIARLSENAVVTAPPQAETGTGIDAEPEIEPRSPASRSSRSKTLMLGTERPVAEEQPQTPDSTSAPSAAATETATEQRLRPSSGSSPAIKISDKGRTLMFGEPDSNTSEPGDTEHVDKPTVTKHSPPAERESDDVRSKADTNKAADTTKADVGHTGAAPSRRATPLVDGPDVELHQPRSVATRAPAARRALWIGLPLLLAAIAFVVVRGLSQPETPKDDTTLLAVLLDTDSSLGLIKKEGHSPRHRLLAATHLAIRNGLAKSVVLDGLLGEKVDAGSGELDAARAIAALAQDDAPSAIKWGRKSAVAPNPTPFARYLAGYALAAAGMQEGAVLLRDVLKDTPRYRDATVALAMYLALNQEKDEAITVLQSAPSDDLEAIVPLFRSALQTPAQPMKNTRTDADLIETYGVSTTLLYEFLHDDIVKLTNRIQESGVRDPLLLSMLAAVADARNAPDVALAATLRAHTLVPNNPALRRTLPMYALRSQDSAQAWEMLASFDKHDAESLQALARSALAQGDDEKLKKTLKIWAQTPDDGSAAQTAMGIELRARSSNLPAAEKRSLLAEATQLTKKFPGNEHTLRALAAAARLIRDNDALEAALEGLVRAAPQDAKTHLGYGTYWMEAGDFDKAETGLTRALSLQPNLDVAAVRLGELLLTHGHYGRAEIHFRNAVKQGTASKVGRTRALAAAGRNIDGLAELEVAAADPELTPEQRVNLAKAALLLARPDHAESLVREQALAPDAHAEVIVVFAKALSARGNAEEATAQLDRALETAPSSTSALLAKGEAAVHAGKPATAHKYLGLASQRVENKTTPPPIQSHYWLLRGRAYLLEGPSKMSRARDALRNSADLRGTPPEAFFFLGESLASVNSPEAAKAYADYVALAPNGPYRKRAERALGARK